MTRKIQRNMVRFVMEKKGIRKINRKISDYFRKTKEFIGRNSI
jgi:hypothetical protein